MVATFYELSPRLRMALGQLGQIKARRSNCGWGGNRAARLAQAPYREAVANAIAADLRDGVLTPAQAVAIRAANRIRGERA